MSRRKRIKRKQRTSETEVTETILANHAKQVEQQMRAMGKPIKTVLNPQGAESMSGAIQEITNPFLIPDMTQDAYERLIALGVTAWNVVLVSDDRRRVLLQKMAEQIEQDADEEAREIFEEFIELLIARRLQLFPHNKRWIIDYVVTDLGDTFHLSVISELTNADNPAPVPTIEMKGQSRSVVFKASRSQRSVWQRLRAWWRSWWQ